MRVLLVEDEPTAAHVLAKGLREQAYAVDLAVDGDTAVFQVGTTDYDAVILDVMLPLKDGFAVCRTIRESGCPVPILMVTARDGAESRIEGLDCGADDYLVKPFDFGELLARIRAVMRRRNPNAGPQLQVQDVTMDDTTREVKRDGRAIELSAREFDLLRLLMMHPNQVLPRDRILDQVWGYNFFGDANNVEVYIRYLRQKLGDEQHQLIQTVRGVGYRIKA